MIINPPQISRQNNVLTFQRLLVRDDDKTVAVRTGLSNEEFEYVVDSLEQYPEDLKRRRKLPELKARLVAILRWLCLGQTFKLIEQPLGLTHSCAQTCIASIWNLLATALYEDLIPRSPLDYTSSRSFINYPTAKRAFDATLISVRRPSEREGDKRYFSDKHGKHGVKLQILSAPDRTCIHYGSIIEGSRNDFYLFEHSTLTRAMTPR